MLLKSMPALFCSEQIRQEYLEGLRYHLEEVNYIPNLEMAIVLVSAPPVSAVTGPDVGLRRPADVEMLAGDQEE